MRSRRLTFWAILALATAVLTPAAQAAGGRYTFDGGTGAERAQVTHALDASSFNWDVVPSVVTVHIAQGVDSDATPGNIWLDSDLLDAGRFAWAVVQHEYAHEVDFLVLTDAMRAELRPSLGGTAWWGTGGEGHDNLTSERFADEIAWSYWTSSQNCLRPLSATDEGGQVAPQAFRALLGSILPGSEGGVRELSHVTRKGVTRTPPSRGFPSGNTQLHSVHR